MPRRGASAPGLRAWCPPRPAGHPPAGTPGAPASAASYQEYRARRDQQAKWERRYRRERPFEARRQEGGK